MAKTKSGPQIITPNEDVFINFLVYGPTGVGKTRLLGSAQECEYTSPVLFLDIEGGTLSLTGMDIDIVRPQNFTEIQDLYDFLRYENDVYRSVAIDSLTELQRKLSMAEIMGVLQEDASYSNLAEHKPPDRYDWLSSGEQMRRFIRAFRDLAYLPDPDIRVHVLFTALEKADEVRSVVCPSLPGVLGMEVGASVDIMARFSLERVDVNGGEKVYRNLSMIERIDPMGTRYLAKCRLPVGSKPPEDIKYPTVQKILSMWTKGREQILD